MAREFAERFYHSMSWRRTRDAYYKARHGLCERCQSFGIIAPGEIVHHKVHLSPENIDDPAISLSFDNLELLCRECHGFRHGAAPVLRVVFDESGNVISAKEDHGRIR